MDARIETEVRATESRIRKIEAHRPMSYAAQWAAWSVCNVQIALGYLTDGNAKGAQVAAQTALRLSSFCVRTGFVPPELREGN